MAAGVLEIAVLAVSYAIVAGQVSAQEADVAQGAVDAADELLERVLALPFADPDGPSALGPEIGETVPTGFDNADDYHGYSDTVALEPGPTAEQFTRSVSMVLGSETLIDLGASVPGLTVTITVEDDQATAWTITRFIPESAP